MNTSPSYAPWEGGLLVDKPAGPTSHDVVHRIRRHFRIKKVGHCGTLDPQATGLLVVLLGRATKMADRLLADDKVYEGAIRFGETTDSYDAEGRIVAQADVPPLTLEQLNTEAGSFLGDQMQTPPMLSAVKKDGVPLYKLARKGIEVERKARLVHVYEFRFLEYHPPLGKFTLACTKGTYIRSLAHELGQKIGCGAHLYTLRRLASGKFNVDRAIPLDRLLTLTPEQLPAQVIGIPRLLT